MSEDFPPNFDLRSFGLVPESDYQRQILKQGIIRTHLPLKKVLYIISEDPRPVKGFEVMTPAEMKKGRTMVEATIDHCMPAKKK